MRVYIAGPITLGDKAHNIRQALQAAKILLENDFEPFVPHLWHFFEIMFPAEYERIMRMDDAYLRVCKALIRLAGESAGSDREVARAISLDIPVFYNIADLIAWRDDQQKMRELVDSVPRVEPAP